MERISTAKKLRELGKFSPYDTEVRRAVMRDVSDPFMAFCRREASARLARMCVETGLEVPRGGVDAAAAEIAGRLYRECFDGRKADRITGEVLSRVAR